MVVMYRDFGAKVVAPAPIIKALPPLFSHKDGKVRATAKTITVRPHHTPPHDTRPAW